MSRPEYSERLIPVYFWIGNRLPAIVVTAVTAATTTAVAVVVTTTATVVATATTTITAGWEFVLLTIFTRFCLLNNNGTAVEFRFIEVADCVLSFLVVGHVNEAEAFGTVSHFVEDNGAGVNGTELLELTTECFRIRVVVQFCYKELHDEK